MTEKAKLLTEWLNHYIKTDHAHKVIARKVFRLNGDCGDYGEEWMWLDDICKQTVNLIKSLSDQLERVTKERDAAVEMFRDKCEYCKHFHVTHNGCTPDCDCHATDCQRIDGHWTGWQWIGVEVNNDA